MTWKELWMTLFHTTDFLGVNIGFWFSMLIVFIIVLIMNVVFWVCHVKRINIIVMKNLM